MRDDDLSIFGDLQWGDVAVETEFPGNSKALPTNAFSEALGHIQDIKERFGDSCIQEVRSWATELHDLLRDQTRAMLQDQHVLVPDLTTIDSHVQRTPSEISSLGRLCARYARKEWELEQNLRRQKRSTDAIKARARGEAYHRLKFQGHYLKRDLPPGVSEWSSGETPRYTNESLNASKNLTKDDLDALVNMDECYQDVLLASERILKDAEDEYARALEEKKTCDVGLEALRLKATLLPGLQGAQNTINRNKFQ